MKKLGVLLQEANIVDEIQLVAALSHQRKWKCRLGKSLIELGFVSEETIAQTVARQVGVRYIELDPTFTPRELFKMIPKWLAEEKRIFPIGYSSSEGWKAVAVAFGDPTDAATAEAIGKHTGMKVQVVVARESAIEDAVSKWDTFAASNPIGGGDVQLDAQLPVSAATNIVEPPPAYSSEPLFETPVAPDRAEADEILSVSDLPPMEDADSMPDIQTDNAPAPESPPEPIIAPTPEAPPEPAPAPEPEPMMEVDHGQPWEHIMPESADALVPASIQPEEIIAGPEDFIAPAYEQLEPPSEPPPPLNDIIIEPGSTDESAEESFASSPSRPNSVVKEPVDIQSLESLIPSSGAPKGDSLLIQPKESETGAAKPPALAPPSVFSKLDVFAVEGSVSNEEILREIKTLRQDVEVLSSLLQIAIKKLGKN